MEDNPSQIFKNILEQNPDLFVWIGDASYVDVRLGPMLFTYDKNQSNVEAKFSTVYNDPYYTALRKKVPVVGVWDDHDYGLNDGDINMPTKDWMRETYLNFLQEPKNSVRRTQEGGIYTSYYLGENNFAKIILLDIRFSKNGSDMLGEAQWKWLSQQLNDDKP